jgi:hypothetical protein
MVSEDLVDVDPGLKRDFQSPAPHRLPALVQIAGPQPPMSPISKMLSFDVDLI